MKRFDVQEFRKLGASRKTGHSIVSLGPVATPRFGQWSSKQLTRFMLSSRFSASDISFVAAVTFLWMFFATDAKKPSLKRSEML